MMWKVEYDKETSLGNFIDQLAINRLQRIIDFEQKCFPQDTKLIRACELLVNHIKSIWDIK